MPTYKLTFFDARGRGEIIRMILKAANIAFEDNRVEFDDWPKIKATTPTGKLPVLEIDGKPYPQSHSLARHLARKNGLAGKNEMEELQADVLADSAEDMLQEIVKFFIEKDEAKKEELFKKFQGEILPNMLGAINKMAEDYGKSGFLVGSDLTWADLRIYDLMETILQTSPDILKSFPALASNRQRVAEHPKIKQYLEDRPESKI